MFYEVKQFFFWKNDSPCRTMLYSFLPLASFPTKKKIETSWKEFDVFLWENHLGSSYEQEEKAWD